MSERHYPALYLQGIAEFNRTNFFESHEIWEELWIAESGPAKSFYKGLIQAAVALLHLNNGNVHGAKKLMSGATVHLDPYRSNYLGLDIDAFLADMCRCFVEACSNIEDGGRPKLNPRLIPKICLRLTA